MPLARYANARDANEPDIVEALEAAGATVIRLDSPTDLLVGWRGRNYLIEIKVPLGPLGGLRGGTLTTDQRRFFLTWRGQRCVARNPREALMAIGAISAVQGEA